MLKRKIYRILRCKTFSTNIAKHRLVLRHLYTYKLDVNSWENAFEKSEAPSVHQQRDQICEEIILFRDL